jgi:hypothetical protein
MHQGKNSDFNDGVLKMHACIAVERGIASVAIGARVVLSPPPLQKPIAALQTRAHHEEHQCDSGD